MYSIIIVVLIIIIAPTYYIAIDQSFNVTFNIHSHCMYYIQCKLEH